MRNRNGTLLLQVWVPPHSDQVYYARTIVSQDRTEPIPIKGKTITWASFYRLQDWLIEQSPSRFVTRPWWALGVGWVVEEVSNHG